MNYVLKVVLPAILIVVVWVAGTLFLTFNVLEKRGMEWHKATVVSRLIMLAPLFLVTWWCFGLPFATGVGIAQLAMIGLDVWRNRKEQKKK